MAKPTEMDRAVAAQKRAARKIKPSAPTLEPQTARVQTTKMNALLVGEDGEPPIEVRDQRIRTELEDLYVETGNVAYRKAAGALVPRPPPNRPTFDDDLAVRRMHALITRGFADNKHQAAKIVFRDLDEDQSEEAALRRHSEEAALRRLTRKYTAFIRKLGVSG